MSDNSKSKFLLVNIKSKYFIKSIFKIIGLKKVLNIIKYNKEFQKRMDFSILNYIYLNIILLL